MSISVCFSMWSRIYFTGRLTSHYYIIESKFPSFLIICRDLCRHLMIPLKDIIQPMLRLLNTNTPGSPVLHRLHIRYVKLLIFQYPYDYIKHILHILWPVRRALMVTCALSCTRVHVFWGVEVVEVQMICFCGLMHYSESPRVVGLTLYTVWHVTDLREHVVP